MADKIFASVMLTYITIMTIFWLFRKDSKFALNVYSFMATLSCIGYLVLYKLWLELINVDRSFYKIFKYAFDSIKADP